MMLQERNSDRWLAIGLTTLVLFFAGCKEEEPLVDPYVTPRTTENPNWVITGDNDMTVSMTAIVKVSFAKEEGTLTAFIGNDCCGIANYNADLGLYWLYISPVTEQGNDVQLRFYSMEQKRIFDATSTFPFRNDTQQGSVANPYTPSWTVVD